MDVKAKSTKTWQKMMVFASLKPEFISGLLNLMSSTVAREEPSVNHSLSLKCLVLS